VVFYLITEKNNVSLQRNHGDGTNGPYIQNGKKYLAK